MFKYVKKEIPIKNIYFVYLLTFKSIQNLENLLDKKQVYMT
jgi:hypothetical protein